MMHDGLSGYLSLEEDAVAQIIDIFPNWVLIAVIKSQNTSRCRRLFIPTTMHTRFFATSVTRGIVCCYWTDLSPQEVAEE